MTIQVDQEEFDLLLWCIKIGIQKKKSQVRVKEKIIEGPMEGQKYLNAEEAYNKLSQELMDLQDLFHEVREQF